MYLAGACPQYTRPADQGNPVALLCVPGMFLPQGTVDNNLGPDRLVGPMALDPNYCRQPTL